MQYGHPMYDAVEDDDYEQSAQLDVFDEHLLQQPYDDRQCQAVRGWTRLSLAPVSSKFDANGVIKNERPLPQTLCMSQNFYDNIEHQLYQENPARGTLSRSAYDDSQLHESSSDTLLGASSSPALDAGRRRATQHEVGTCQRSPLLRYVEDCQPAFIEDQRVHSSHSHKHHESLPGAPQHDVVHPFEQLAIRRLNPHSMKASQMPPTVQGIPLVPMSALPDRLRTVFPFPTFNAVQSKCFDPVFRSDNNFVLSSPTGSGKTAILELAVCRAVAKNSTDRYKVVYQAPTKALCSERQRDWEKKFAQIGLRCAELTGDSDASDLRSIQSANIIVTTPEKWDSMTRKWKDHEILMGLIKLFLIDEVHILNEDRGAVLEAVVSRMKSIGTDVRFVALSATVPNLCDVAAWLGKSSTEPYALAANEKFGEEFRPVKLRKYVHGYVNNSSNEFAFEKQLDAKLPEIIAKYSERKPTMIFCATRKSCNSTAQIIANWWCSRKGRDRPWDPPSQALHMKDRELGEVVASGVAFHHAGVDLNDRLKVERGFFQGEISVICCTSTLAVGVNLPCHLVIVKNTVAWTQEGAQEYSDLEMMQMLGRAGRPQFDDSAVAVIMTRQTKVRRYETLVTGQEILESKLHINLIDHLNAEIGLGTIRDLESARKWLTSTFLYVRLQQNPVHYKLQGSRTDQDIQEHLDDICFRDTALLRRHDLMVGEDYFRATEFGHAMARHYVHFETMKVFMGLQPKSTLSEILSAMAQASEFSKIRFRQGEKSIYKRLNSSPSIRFPIPVNLDLPAQKVSLIIQSILGAADISWEDGISKTRTQYNQEVAMIFRSIHSLIRCIIDCQICLGDSVTIHSALMFERCLGSRAWDDSPLQMIQIPDIGAVAIRKLVNAGIRGIEDLEGTDAQRIETVVGRNPPFGLKILDALKSFPKLRVSLHIQPASATKTSDGVKVQVKADIGFMNNKAPDKFGNKVVYVCMLAETSDGRKIHFARIKGPKLGTGQSLMFPALLTSRDQTINCYLMCEGIAGSMRGATVTPKLAPSMFPVQATNVVQSASTHQPNMSRRCIGDNSTQRKKSIASDKFGDVDIGDEALVEATLRDSDFAHIDNFSNPTDVFTQNKATKGKGRAKFHTSTTEYDDYDVPIQLPNGRWSCNHKCKDKEACKHYCCEHGMKKPPKKAAPSHVSTEGDLDQSVPKSTQKIQTKLQLQTSKRKSPATIEELDLTHQEKRRKNEYTSSGPRDGHDLHSFDQHVSRKGQPSHLLAAAMNRRPTHRGGESGEHGLLFLSQLATTSLNNPSEHDSIQLDKFKAELHNEQTGPREPTLRHLLSKAPVTSRGSEIFDDDDSMFNAAIVGLADSQDFQHAISICTSNVQSRDTQAATHAIKDFAGVNFLRNMDSSAHKEASGDLSKQLPTTMRTPFFEATSSPGQYESQDLQKPQQDKDAPKQPAGVLRHCSERDNETSDLLGLLDVPLALSKESVQDRDDSSTYKPLAQSIGVKQQELEQAPEGFKDLQPWLFQEFGDIVELVDE